MLLINSCTTSPVLIHSDDSIFAEAQKHMEHTFQTILKINTPLEERLLFLQAESFYSYRFKLPKHSSKTFLAEAAAAITDFPAFQSLAGSFSLLDLDRKQRDNHKHT